MGRIRRWLWPLALAIAVAAGLVYAFLPQPVPVELAEVVRGPLAVSVADDAKTRVRELYVVSAPVPGRVLRIEGKVGDPVIADRTVLASLLPTDPAFWDARTRAELEATRDAAQAALGQARADVRRRQAELELARSEFDRSRTLFEKGHTAEAALDRARSVVRTAEAALAVAQAMIKQRESELAAARAALMTPSAEGRADAASCCFTVRSPVSGAILQLMQESEAVVAAGAPLVAVGDPEKLEIVADLLSTDAVRVSPGDAVRIVRWGGEGVLGGRVRRIEPFGVTKVSALGIEEQRVNVLIDPTDPPARWRRLGHGYQVEVEIVIWQSADAVQVPLGALFRQGEAWAVFRVEDGRARVRAIEVGHMNDRAVEVLEGLAPGDRVVVHPSDRVRDGVHLTAD